jgi:hypothetical protein
MRGWLEGWGGSGAEVVADDEEGTVGLAIRVSRIRAREGGKTVSGRDSIYGLT